MTNAWLPDNWREQVGVAIVIAISLGALGAIWQLGVSSMLHERGHRLYISAPFGSTAIVAVLAAVLFGTCFALWARQPPAQPQTSAALVVGHELGGHEVSGEDYMSWVLYEHQREAWFSRVRGEGYQHYSESAGGRYTYARFKTRTPIRGT